MNKVLISEMIEKDGLYEVTFHGSAEDYGFSNETDYLSAEEAYEIAMEVSGETNSVVVWDGYKPSWA